MNTLKHVVTSAVRIYTLERLEIQQIMSNVERKVKQAYWIEWLSQASVAEMNVEMFIAEQLHFQSVIDVFCIILSYQIVVGSSIS